LFEKSDDMIWDAFQYFGNDQKLFELFIKTWFLLFRRQNISDLRV